MKSELINSLFLGQAVIPVDKLTATLDRNGYQYLYIELFTMHLDESLQLAAKELEINTGGLGPSGLKQVLADTINEMIQTGFEKLVNLLYRMDVSETKLKQVLKEYPGYDAGTIIAELIIERQEQKIKSRQESDSNRISQRDNTIDEDEKW